MKVFIKDNGVARDNSITLLHRILRDINDMNAYTASIGNPTNWIAAIEWQELRILPGFPLREDFDVPKYQVKITIPKASII